jgi:hypothetical protein
MISSSFSSVACFARVARMSSASKPSISMIGMRSTPRTSRISGSCWLNTSGVSRRFALYSVYFSIRKTALPLSKATTTPSGFSSAMSLMSIDVKP